MLVCFRYWKGFIPEKSAEHISGQVSSNKMTAVSGFSKFWRQYPELGHQSIHSRKLKFSAFRLRAQQGVCFPYFPLNPISLVFSHPAGLLSHMIFTIFPRLNPFQRGQPPGLRAPNAGPRPGARPPRSPRFRGPRTPRFPAGAGPSSLFSGGAATGQPGQGAGAPHIRVPLGAVSSFSGPFDALSTEFPFPPSGQSGEGHGHVLNNNSMAESCRSASPNELVNNPTAPQMSFLV